VVVASDESRAIVVDVATTAPDLGSVAALTRLQLAARRYGRSIRLRNASQALRDLIELVGLADVLLLEAEGQPKGREELGVEEVVQPGDPTF
jgi:ABC-type transporter Mla MlaB component